MTTVNIFRDFVGAEFDTYAFEPGLILSDCCPAVDWQNTIVLADGRPVDEHYRLVDGAVVSMRTFPAGGVVTTVTNTVTNVVRTVQNAWNNSSVGSAVNNFFSGVGNWFQSTIQSWIGVDVNVDTNVGLSPSSAGSTASAGDTETIPSIKGARNQTQNGRPIPLVLGTSLLTPMYAGIPYTLIGGTDGEEQHYYALFMVGYKDLEVSNIKLGELDLASNSAKVTDGSIEIDGAGRFNGVVELEIRSGDEEVSFYPQKVVQENLQFQLLHPDDDSGHWLVSERFSATYPQKIQVEISFNNLMRYDSSGNVVSTSVAVKLEISFDGGATYEPFGAFTGASAYASDGTSTFTRAKNKNLRFVAERTLTYAEAMNCLNDVAQIRIQRLTRESTDTKIQDRCYVTGIRTWTFDKAKSKDAGVLVSQSPIEQRIRSKTVRLGLKIRASESFSDLNGTINQLSMIVTSKCRTWNGTNWSQTETPTANPAAVALKTMQSPMMGSYAYSDDKIDLLKFGELYEFCEEHNFSVGGVLVSQKKLSETIDAVLSTCRSMRVLDGGKYSVVIDKPRTVPVTVLNNHNFLNGGRKNMKEFRELPDGVKIKFINRRLNFTEDEIFCMYDGKSADDSTAKLESMQMVWQTDPDQVWKNGRYELAKRKLRPESFTADVGIEGNLIEIGSLVSIQDDTILVGIGDGGEIKEVLLDGSGSYATGIVIDGAITVSDIDHEFAIKCVHADLIHEPVVCVNKVSIPAAGDYKKFDFSTPVLVTDPLCPAVGDIISFGIYGSETIDVLCFGKKDNADGTFSLTLSPYDENVYTADTGAIPEFNSKVTEPQMSGSYDSVSGYVTEDEIMQEIIGLKGGEADVAPPDIPVIQTASAGKDLIELECGIFGAGLNNAIKYVEWQINKGDGWEDIGQTVAMKTEYKFDRDVDGYPEVDDLYSWQVRAKAVNLYGKESLFCQGFPVSTAGYGTWLLQPPSIFVRVSDRTVTLILSQPKTSQNREVYGTLRYRVQIKRPDLDGNKWYKPATTLDPFASELNYKDGVGYVESESMYVQTMPLKGQDDSDIVDTLYMFSVCAQNEAGISTHSEVQATALCTSIRDIVHANETAKEAYISQLSAISANLGAITQGAFGENDNMWDLSTFTDDMGFQHYEGKFHVGGKEQYLHFDPILENGVPTGEFTIEFSVGSFHITSDSSSIDGELIVQYAENSLDRTRITQKGTYYEHRDTVSSPWAEIASDSVLGVHTQLVYSDKHLVFTNQTITQRRKEKTDIGNPYLSENSVVYHFDENFKDQDGNEGLTFDGSAILCGEESSGEIDFTPAILAISPYAQVGKSAYGQFSASKMIAASNDWTVDFWIQYLYAENQVIFDIGNAVDKVTMTVQAAEAFYNDLKNPATTEDDNFFYSHEQGDSELYIELLVESVLYNEDAYVQYNERDAETEPYYNKRSVKDWESGYVYYERSEQGLYTEKQVSKFEYDDAVKEGLYECDCVYNEIEEAQSYISHEGSGGKETVPMSSFGCSLKENEWVHIGIISSGTKLSVFVNHGKIDFDKYSETARDNAIILNREKTSFILDELFIDGTEAELFAMFSEHTTNRIPWAALDKNEKWFIVESSEDSSVLTNLFEAPVFADKMAEFLNSAAFRAKVLEIVS